MFNFLPTLCLLGLFSALVAGELSVNGRSGNAILRRHHQAANRQVAPQEPGLTSLRKSKLRRKNAPRKARHCATSQVPSTTSAPSDTATQAITSSTEVPVEAVSTTSVAPDIEIEAKAAPKRSSTSAAPKATEKTTSGGSGSGSGEVFRGEATFYATGLGACGITSNDGQMIAAVSMKLFDGFEGYTGGNPNKNPICGKKARVTLNGKTIVVTLVDRCVGCARGDLDFSPTAFNQIADPDKGRVPGMTWQII